MNVTYSILTYGRQDLLIRCLQSFRKFHPEDPLIVTDNGGPEGDKSKAITEMYGGLYLNNPPNDSLSKIMNMGVEASKTPYTCITTNGVIFTKRLTEQFEANFIRDPKIAVVGGLLFYPSGRIQHGGGFRRWNEGRMGHYGHGKEIEQAGLCLIPAYRMYVTGAVAAIRKEFWETNHYDEQLTMSCEDTDICMKAWVFGNRVFYDPEITAIHEEGATRGASVAEKKVKHPEVIKREEESVRIFEERYNDQDFWEVDRELNRLNRLLHPELPRGFVRTAGMGDVLLTLPIYRYLEQKEKGNIVVITQMMEVFREEHPKALTQHIDEYPVSDFINFDLAYERRRQLSIRKGYIQALVEQDGMPAQMNYPDGSLNSTAWDEFMMRRQVLSKDWNGPYAVVHVKTGVGPKSLRPDFWAELIDLIQTHLWLSVVLVGGDAPE
ncbi:MAG: glycosyltransferase, partial [Patescibacteria group bacterium]|nr:glycosyltransferase [Patescibacteria group bacterium]